MPDANAKNNEAKGFGGLMPVLLVIGAMAAMWLPLADRQSTLKDDLKDHESPESHARVQTVLLEALSERLTKLEGWREDWLARVPALDATQNARLDMIEREMFNSD